MKKFTEFSRSLDEAATHPMAVHAYPTDKSYTSFKVHKVGSDVKHVKAGETVSSSDLDDLSDSGHKVKEVKAPKAMKEEADALDEAAAKLTPGQPVSFTHSQTGKKIMGNYKGNIRRGGYSYAHVEAGKLAYHVPHGKVVQEKEPK